MSASLDLPLIIPAARPGQEHSVKCIHQVFEAQAARTPGSIAVEFEGTRLTYQQLDLHADRFAARLRSLGVRAGTFVALYAPRSLETVVSLLGILKSGGAYVALDMESPANRLALMLSDAVPAVILTLREFAGQLPVHDAQVLFMDEEFDLRNAPVAPVPRKPDASVSADSLAYVAFTSGSSGAPKGVCIPHRGVVRLAKATDYITIGNDDVFLQFAPLSFDASTFEIWCCLLNGAKLVIFPPRKPSLGDLGEFIERERVSILWLTAGLFHRMAEGQLHHFRHVRQLFTGGDVVSVPHAEKALRALDNCRLVNGYGPTENTTFSCCHVITKIPASGQSIPIGGPIAGTECHVLDEMLRPVTPGETGELYLGGEGLAVGYLRKPELTARKFIPHPFNDSPGGRLYRTGDRVLFLPDGTLEFHGRMDRQVKILGYRVELDEVEAALRRHPTVEDAAVIACGAIAGSEQLKAAVAFKPGMQATTAGLRTFARQSLPAHMVPADFVFVSELPLNPNGKIDQEALAALCTPRDAAAASPLPADHTATEAVLAKIWSSVLDRPDFKTTDNFFEIGGNSLRAAHLLARLHAEFRKAVSMDALLAHPTIVRLAALLDATESTPTIPVCHVRKGGPKPGIFWMPTHGGLTCTYNATAAHYSGERPVYGLQSPGLLGFREGTTVEEIAAGHVKTILSQQPSGPYHLFGYCFGGLVAFETARQLHAQGAVVGAVGALHLDLHEMPFAPFRFRGITPFLRFAANLLLLPGELFALDERERKAALRRMVNRVLHKFRGSEPALVTPPPMTAELHVWQTHYNAWRNYVPRAFPGVVTLLRPRRLPLLHPDPRFGWDSVPGQPLEVRIVPGAGINGHSISGENAIGTAKVIEDVVRRRERGEMPHGA